jgi:hypothetical protein
MLKFSYYCRAPERNSKAFNPPYLDYDTAQVALVNRLVGLLLSFYLDENVRQLAGRQHYFCVLSIVMPQTSGHCSPFQHSQGDVTQLCLFNGVDTVIEASLQDATISKY